MMISFWIMALASVSKMRQTLGRAHKCLRSRKQSASANAARFDVSDCSSIRSPPPRKKRSGDHHGRKKQKMRKSPGPPRASIRSGSGRLIMETRPGHVMVRVGTQRSKFTIPTNILTHHLFQLMLEKLERKDESKYDETGAILLPCEAEFFHRLLFLIDSSGKAAQEMGWDELRDYLEGMDTIE